MFNSELNNYPVRDDETINELRSVMEEGFTDLVLILLRDMPAQLAAIEEAAYRGDAQSLYRSAHNLKSGCGSIGAMQLSHVAKQLEQLGRYENLAATSSLLKQLRHTAQQTRIAFEALLNSS